MRVLLAQRGDLSLVTKDGRSALHALVYMGDPELLREAIAQGANLQHRDEEGETPFLTAAGYASAGCLKVLGDAGADVTACDATGRTAADLLVKRGPLHEDSDRVVGAAARVITWATIDAARPT